MNTAEGLLQDKQLLAYSAKQNLVQYCQKCLTCTVWQEEPKRPWEGGKVVRSALQTLWETVFKNYNENTEYAKQCDLCPSCFILSAYVLDISNDNNVYHADLYRGSVNLHLTSLNRQRMREIINWSRAITGDHRLIACATLPVSSASAVSQNEDINTWTHISRTALRVTSRVFYRFIGVKLASHRTVKVFTATRQIKVRYNLQYCYY